MMEQLSRILQLQLDRRPSDGNAPLPLHPLSSAPSFRWEPPVGTPARWAPPQQWDPEATAAVHAAGRRGSLPGEE